jgi:hypothetical protein
MDASNASNVAALEPWLQAGFDVEEAAVWSTTEPRSRFTPHTARAWADAGFEPADAALWSDECDDPIVARERRNSRVLSPYPIPICG